MMKEDMVAKLAMLLIDDSRASSMTEALDVVINSETYERLIYDKAALYYQSPRYVYEFLKNELLTGKDDEVEMRFGSES